MVISKLARQLKERLYFASVRHLVADANTRNETFACYVRGGSLVTKQVVIKV